MEKLSEMDAFKTYLEKLLSNLKTEMVTLEDAPTIHRELETLVKKMEKSRKGLIHEWVVMKSRGRIVIPENLRNAIGATEGTVFDAHIIPNMKKPRGIALIMEGRRL